MVHTSATSQCQECLQGSLQSVSISLLVCVAAPSMMHRGQKQARNSSWLLVWPSPMFDCSHDRGCSQFEAGKVVRDGAGSVSHVQSSKGVLWAAAGMGWVL